MKNFWMTTLMLSLIVALSGCDSDHSEPVNSISYAVVGQILTIEGQELTLALTDSSLPEIRVVPVGMEETAVEESTLSQQETITLSTDMMIETKDGTIGCEALNVGDWLKCSYQKENNEEVLTKISLLEAEE